ncbi:V-set and immunoglobulin domain-containing protein 10-like [Mugil cephalus]|uniref:V-set and immunoglobulin domain-containing protein 10-like n=1 Tax=Mugil cephalus TaxID=48193 RepID=UPI001FB833FD|nr:V-set and immunoglobulin domain-containing protein 10-like [Mugil cephalus]
MTRLEEFNKYSAVFLAILFYFSFQGARSQLVVSPAGPALVNALVGSNVTLAVSFSGAPDPGLVWLMGGLPVATWKINSVAAPEIAQNRRDVIRVEENGSLTFVNVTLAYTERYTIEMTKPGLEKASTNFTLKIFETLPNVTLSSQPEFAKEGTDRFMLHYSVPQDVVEQQTWLFNGKEIKNNSHYLVEQGRLVILRPNRSDTGQYTLLIANPFSRATAQKNVSVLYGPDEPILEARPAKLFYIPGDSVILSCQADGFPKPTPKWLLGDRILSTKDVLSLENVQTSEGGVYTCILVNEQTEEERQNNLTLNVYEKPPGKPLCSVHSVNDVKLQYRCGWMGGTPQARLSFPALSNASSGEGNFSLTVNASDNLNRKTIKCMADHPVQQNQCNITASSPVVFPPAVRTTLEGKMVVTIHCMNEASPMAVVSWYRGNVSVTNGTMHQVSSSTTQLEIRHFNVSYILLQNYTCIGSNPLGSQTREIQLQGPSISDFSLFPNQDGTVITLTWEVPPTSVVTGFNIQMKGPDLLSKYSTYTKASSDKFRTIQVKPGSARSTDVFPLEPDLTYRFRVIPKAHQTQGEPSTVHRIGPGEGLSGPAIAGIAAGIPCSLLFLLLLGGLIYLCIYCSKNKNHHTRYPVSRAVEKAKTTQPDTSPHNLLTGGLKSPPDYNRLQQTPSERSVALPSFIPAPPVRVATTV